MRARGVGADGEGARAAVVFVVVTHKRLKLAMLRER